MSRALDRMTNRPMLSPCNTIGAIDRWEAIAGDPEACRKRFDAQDVAHMVRRAHWDIAACYCPACAMARVVIDAAKQGKTSPPPRMTIEVAP